MSGRGIISVENPQQCDDCGKIAELRPYGPNGKVICHPCALKYPREIIEANMMKHLFG